VSGPGGPGPGAPGDEPGGDGYPGEDELAGYPDDEDELDGYPDEAEDGELDGNAADLTEELMAGFRRTRQGVSVLLTAGQARILRNLVGQVADLVGGPGAASAPPAARNGEPGFPEDLLAVLDAGGPTSPPDDPVLARLFPDAYGDDPDAAGDFRRYTEPGLRSGKVAAARTVLDTLPEQGGRVRLSGEDAQVWLRALNDVRLALGVVLGITEDYERELDDAAGSDPRSAYLQVYDWLTFLQETLVRTLR
jgi:hypothetical protein